MNLADVQVELRDVWGREIRGAEVEVVEKPGRGGSHWRAEVTKPGYLREGVNLDFRGKGVEPLVLLMDPEQCQCVAMLKHPTTKARGRRATQDREVIAEILMEAAAKHVGVYAHGLAIAKRAPDRVWWHCSASLIDFLDHSGAWYRDPNRGRGHSYEPGWDRVGSWRSNTHVVSMQATVYRRLRTLECPECEGSGDSPAFDGEECCLCHGCGDVPINGSPPSAGDYEYVVELDLDMAGFRHVTQVLWNWLADDETDPLIMAQLCAFYWPLQLPFEMRVKGAPS